MTSDPDPAEVAAELRKLLNAVKDGRLVADPTVVSQIEGAVAALEEIGKPH